MKGSHTFCCLICGSVLFGPNNLRYCSEVCRFLGRVTIPGNIWTDCWVYHGGKGHFGYGVFRARRPDGKGTVSKLAHRESVRLFYGIDPGGQCVLHLCDNPPCVSPFHMRLGDRDINSKDAAVKGRVLRGLAHHKSKLTPELVEEIRNSKESNMYWERALGVSNVAISRVRRGLAWKRLD